MKNPRLNEIADQVIRAVTQLEEKDPRSAVVRHHLQELVAALRPAVLKSTPPPSFQRHDTPAETPRAITEKHYPPMAQPPSFVPEDFAPGGQFGAKVRVSSVAPKHSDRPGLLTERRELRRQAGVSLKQVALAAKTTLPTARMYEIKRTAVGKVKRKALDAVYKSFRRE